jgi:hypothetical protein
MKKIILFLLILNFGLFVSIQLVASEQAQSSYPLPEIHPEKIEILNQHVFEEVYQDQPASEGQ